MHGQRLIDEYTKQRILNAHKPGVSIRDLKRLFGFSERSISNVLHQGSGTAQFSKLTDKD